MQATGTLAYQMRSYTHHFCFPRSQYFLSTPNLQPNIPHHYKGSNWNCFCSEQRASLLVGEREILRDAVVYHPPFTPLFPESHARGWVGTWSLATHLYTRKDEAGSADICRGSSPSCTPPYLVVCEVAVSCVGGRAATECATSQQFLRRFGSLIRLLHTVA